MKWLLIFAVFLLQRFWHCCMSGSEYLGFVKTFSWFYCSDLDWSLRTFYNLFKWFLLTAPPLSLTGQEVNTVHSTFVAGLNKWDGLTQLLASALCSLTGQIRIWNLTLCVDQLVSLYWAQSCSACTLLICLLCVENVISKCMLMIQLFLLTVKLQNRLQPI